MHTLKQWAGAAVAAIALGGFVSPAAADAPGPNYQATPQYRPAPVQPVYRYAPRPVAKRYLTPLPPPPVVYYDPAPPPVVVYPRRYRYLYGGYPYARYAGSFVRHHGLYPRSIEPRHFGAFARGYASHGRHWHR